MEHNEKVLEIIEAQFMREQKQLKAELDELWDRDLSEARPVLARMQKLVNVLTANGETRPSGVCAEIVRRSANVEARLSQGHVDQG